MTITRQELEAIQARLYVLRDELQGLAAQSEQSSRTVELDQSSVGRLSRMDALQAQQMAIEANRRRLAQLQQVELALLRLDRGEYGSCVECGEEVAPRRLAVNPLTLRCISCAQQGAF